MGRRQQANARTLSFAVRKLFQPVLTDIPTIKSIAAPTTTNHIYSDELISTQPDEVSDKSLGKRRRTVDTDGLDDADDDEGAQRVISVERGADAVSTDAVQTLYTKSNLPEALQKYWWQRYRLFSRYDEGIRMDYDGWFSVTPENVASQIAERCRCNVIVDAFCGVGGNAIQFAMTCEKVIAIDNSPVRLACAKANAKIYGVEDRITFIQADYIAWAKARSADDKQEPIEVVFMSPPWGGIEYQEEASQSDDDPNLTTLAAPKATSLDTAGPYASYSLSRLAPLHGRELFNISRKLTKNIAYFLPRNQDVAEAAALVDSGEPVECEEEWMGSKLKALTFYYGDLVKA